DGVPGATNTREIGKPRSTGKRLRALGATLLRTLFAGGVSLVVFLGWQASGEDHIAAADGTGYWLGIVGASAMLLLLVYPLRKRSQRLAFIGPIRMWFSIHMFLGIMGPLLILFHCNFRLGSLNSNVALFVMLTVAASGLIGRYLHGKIYRRLDGRRIEVNALMEDLVATREALREWWGADEQPMQALASVAEMTSAPPRGLSEGIWRLIRLSLVRGRVRSRFLSASRRALIEAQRDRGWSGRDVRRRQRAIGKLFNAYIEAVSQLSRFTVYDRLFALWHVLHMPLFVLLILSVLAHVVGVHLY
ncbi:MAG: hypothetical protein R3D44_13515, partial [Hyphomicrobiaceae bacterium]